MRKLYWMGWALGLGMWGCSTTPEEDLPKFLLNGPDTLTLTLQDTSQLLTAVKTTVDNLGRRREDANYMSFSLISSDTNVVAIIDRRRAFGRAVGTAVIRGLDDKGFLPSGKPLPSGDSITVRVRLSQ